MIKLALLKSGEEVISEMKEMYAKDQVVGYILHHPCRAILTTPEIQVDAGFGPCFRPPRFILFVDSED